MHGFYDFILCKIKEMGKMIRVCEGSCGIVSFTNTIMYYYGLKQQFHYSHTHTTPYEQLSTRDSSTDRWRDVASFCRNKRNYDQRSLKGRAAFNFEVSASWIVKIKFCGIISLVPRKGVGHETRNKFLWLSVSYTSTCTCIIVSGSMVEDN